MPQPSETTQNRSLRNVDDATVRGFGDEWSRFDQTALSSGEYDALFAQYFHIFPWDTLPRDAVGADVGSGSGRWARGVAPRVKTLHLVDASAAALSVARRGLRGAFNTTFQVSSAGELSFRENSLDFVYSLGVLHHVPDTAAALRECVRCLKPGAPILLYLYYAFDNRPSWYRKLWKASDIMRRGASRLPLSLRYGVSQLVAGLVYWPLARLAACGARIGLNTTVWPLAYYADRSFYTMRTDALDRFGTRLEQRFTRDEIERLMRDAGLGRIVFSSSAPFWCVLGFKDVTESSRT